MEKSILIIIIIISVCIFLITLGIIIYFILNKYSCKKDDIILENTTYEIITNTNIKKFTLTDLNRDKIREKIEDLYDTEEINDYLEIFDDSMDKKIILYCRKGIRSARAYRLLESIYPDLEMYNLDIRKFQIMNHPYMANSRHHIKFIKDSKNFKSFDLSLDNLNEQVPLDPDNYGIKVNESNLENYKNFFNKSYLETIDMFE